MASPTSLDPVSSQKPRGRILFWALPFIWAVLLVYWKIVVPAWLAHEFKRVQVDAASVVVMVEGGVYELVKEDARRFLQIVADRTTTDNGVELNVLQTMRVDVFGPNKQHIGNLHVKPGNREGGVSVYQALADLAQSGRPLSESEQDVLYSRFPDCRNCLGRSYFD